MYCLRSSFVVWGLLVLAVVAKPYHVKITKHSNSKSRDLSKQHDMNNFVPEYDEGEDVDDDDELDQTHYVPMTVDADEAKIKPQQPEIPLPGYGHKHKDENHVAKNDNDKLNDVVGSESNNDKKQKEDVNRAEDEWSKSWGDSMKEDYGSEEYDGDMYEEDQDGEPTGIKKAEDVANGVFDDKDGQWHQKSEMNELYDKTDIKDEGSMYNKKKELELKLKSSYDPCDAVFCHYGRVCKSYPDGAATCECADESFCTGHKKQVCGTDGVWYPSHCELHRQACLRAHHISVDHSGDICHAEDDNRKLMTKNDKKEMQKKPSDKKDKKEIDESENRELLEEVTPLKPADLKIESVKKINYNDLYQDGGKKLKKELKANKKMLKDEMKENNKKKNKKQSKKDRKEKKKNKKHNKKQKATTMPTIDSNLLHEQKKDTEDIILGNSLKQEKQSKIVKSDALTVPTVSPTPPKSEESISPSEKAAVKCEKEEFNRLKDNLMLYHCARIGENECYSLGSKKQALANIMFHYYDRSGNNKLDAEELSDIEHQDHLGKLSQHCHLTDIFTFDDSDVDLNITISEFYRAFDVATASLDDKLKLFTSTVTNGNSLELKCDVKGAAQIVWKRNGGLLSEISSDEMRMFEDGSLYIGHVGLHHLGNYTCQAEDNDDVIQTHVLRVQMPPKAKVNPGTQFHTTGSTVTLHCHVNGVPKPEITWEKNEAPLPDDPMHYTMLYNNATLEIRTALYTTDTGAYKCKAKNKAGTDQDIGTVFIENNKVPKYSKVEIEEEFMVFHDEGYSVYEPDRCNIEHQVTATFSDFKRVPLYGSTVSTLCAEEEACAWGGAANVKNEYIFVTQPKLNRVVVINIRENHTPVELIQTDVTPVSIQYVAHLDQIWVVCWNGEENSSAKTVVVIRDASTPVQHHTVHTQPIGDRFDLVKDLFLPPVNDLDQQFNYGYTVHGQQQGLYKLDLQALKYVHTIDLTEYKCVPTTVAFLPIGGQVMVYCTAPEGEDVKSSRLVLDYITDKVLDFVDLGGQPHVSPDSQYTVTVDTNTNTIAVYKVNDDGKLQHVFEEYTSFHVSDLTFFPSERGHSYDFFATSADRNDLLYINLASGKIEMIEGIGEAIPASEWLWSEKNRVIVSGGVFGDYLMTPSENSVVVIDGRRRHVQCEWEQLKHANVIVWIKPQGHL